MSRHVLVLIEDDPGDAFLVTDMLADVAPDVAVQVFTTLTAALADWPADADSVLLDLGLPDAVGLSALERLRAKIPDVPVVVLTGRIDDASGQQALAAGAQDFLVKGQVDGPALERSLRYAVERGRATRDQRELVAAQVRAQENTRLQRGLLPNPLLRGTDLKLSLFYRPGRERALLGGDFYDIVETDSGVHLLIGDVSGHGPDEAALGVALRIAWRSLVLAGLPASDVLLGVEQVLLAERGDDERFATVAMVSLDPDLATADLLLCGHPPPLLMTKDGVVEMDAEPAPALTMVPGTAPAPARRELGADWGMLLFTDGLVEGCESPRSTGRLGVQWLAAHLEGLLDGGLPGEDLARTLVAEAESLHGGSLPDDVAVIVVGTPGWWR